MATRQEVAGIYARIGLQLTEAIRGLRDFRARLIQTSGWVKQLRDQAKISGVGISAGITAPLALVGKTAVSMVADYEKSMNVFQFATKASAEEMALASKVVQQLGADLSLPQYGADQAAAALATLGKSGMSAKDSIDALRPSLLLAAAGEMKNASDAAEILADAINAFGLSGRDAARVADLLAGAEIASTASIKDVADAMRQASAVFAQAGVPIDVLVTMIAQLANAGIKGSDAGTSLKTMLLALISPTEEAAALMRGLGIHIYDAQGQMRPFRDIIGDFQGALGRLTEAQRNQYLATIFGSDAVRAAAVIFGKEGVQGFDAMHDAVTRTGQAQELADAKTKGLSGALEGLWKTVKNEMMNAILPFKDEIADLARGASGLGKAFGELDPETQKMVVGLVTGVAVAGPMIVALAGLAGAVGVLLSPMGLLIGLLAIVGGYLATHPEDLAAVARAFAGLTAFVRENHGAQVLLAGAVGGLLAAWLLLNAGFLATPLGLILTGLAALAAALIYAYNTSSTFRSVVDGAFAAVSGAVTTMWSVVRPILELFESTVGSILKSLGLLPTSLPSTAAAAQPPTPTTGSGQWSRGQMPAGAVAGPDSQGRYQYKVESADGRSSWYEWRDQGGPGRAGKGYAIGVPELFVPDTGGQFVPLGGAQVVAGGGPSINFYGPVFGFADFEDHVVKAYTVAKQKGRIS